MEAKQTSLIDLLERIPQGARLVVEHDQFSSSSHPVGRLCHEAAAALKAALAQQDKPVTEDMKSAVRWAPSSAYWSQQLRGLFGPDAREGIDALERRLAEAQQAEPVEPVAYIHRQGNHWEVSERHLDSDEKARGWTEEPLYTAPPPPQRQPLTQEESDNIYREFTPYQDKLTPSVLQRVVRAVERAHGIKE